MNTVETAIIISCLAWNIVVFFLYGADKRRARRGTWRISEKTLLLAAVFMGGVGALFGMGVFRHKTGHLKFRLGVPMAVLLNVLIVYAVVVYCPFPR